MYLGEEVDLKLRGGEVFLFRLFLISLAGCILPVHCATFFVLLSYLSKKKKKSLFDSPATDDFDRAKFFQASIFLFPWKSYFSYVSPVLCFLNPLCS